MMLLNNPQTDPLVEILRLAYRRGLALRQQQEEEKQTARPENFAEDTGQAEVKQPTPEGVNRE
jgi:hypothetical protein